MDYFYVALVPDSGSIEFAEHFEDESVARDRARQLSMEITCRAGDGNKYSVYAGREPYEAYKARTDAETEAQKAYTPETWDDAAALLVKAAGDKAAAKAKSTSVLTAPPIDVTSEAEAEASKVRQEDAYLADPTADEGEKAKILALREHNARMAAQSAEEES